MSSKQRDRGRVLTSDGLSRLQQAIRAWELAQEVRCTQERIKELSSATKEGGLDPGTIRKILKAKEGVDPESIRCLFTTFGLQLEEADLVASPRPQADPNFVGREAAIADLNALVNRGVQLIVIQARGGVGKTTLARKYLQQEFGGFLEFPIAKETKDIASIEGLIEEKLRQLGEEPGREFFVSLDRLKRKLQAERIGILIDNLEPALDASGKLIEPHRRYVELLRVLADPSVQSTTLITSRERLNESSISVQHYLLQDLALAAWKQYFLNRFQLFAPEAWQPEAESVLAALHQAYGGNAKAMDILCGAILTDYAGNVEAYWQANQDDLLIERALEDLVVGQFDRLQQVDPDAYNLLCRMGCYRYQDVPTVPLEGLLCLLWDVPENRQRRVVKSLQERALVEFANGEYWLHPVIRAEAIGRLRNCKDREDWEKSNREAAGFWRNKVRTVDTINDLIQAFEAYYHYLEIHDFEGAGSILLEPRKSSIYESDGLVLGSSFQRLGLSQQLVNAVNQLIKTISSVHLLSNLYNMLGVAYRSIGEIYAALDCHQKCMALINHQTSSSIENIKILKVRCLVNIGICKVYIWELKEALIAFKEAECTIEKLIANKSFEETGTNHTTQTFLLVLEIFLDPDPLFIERLDFLYKELRVSRYLGRPYRMFYLGEAYAQAGALNKAMMIFHESLLYTRELNYKILEATILNSTAVVYAKQKDFENALNFHEQAFKILGNSENRGELANAYYKLGLTYQAMNEIKKSNESFQEAIRLFTEMDAPRQVERVRRSMEH